MIISRLSPPAPDAVLFAVSGDLDLSSTDALREQVSSALTPDTTVVIFDLADLQFIDSSGLRGLEQCREDASSVGARVAVVRASRAALKLLAITGMQDTWPNYLSPHEALVQLDPAT